MRAELPMAKVTSSGKNSTNGQNKSIEVHARAAEYRKGFANISNAATRKTEKVKKRRHHRPIGSNNNNSSIQ